MSSAPLARSGAAGGMLATARLTGQTIGATLAALTFRFAANAEPIALGTAAGFAIAAAVASLWRLRHAPSPPSSTPQPVADAL